MLTPAMTAAKTYYKVGQNITFGWNYTSLSNEPKAIDVYVTCTANSATYTITNNMTFQSSAKAVWDTLPEQTGANPLLTEQYHLVIHDAAKDVTDIAAAGNLGAYQQFLFAMYTPQAYQNLTGTCVPEDVLRYGTANFEVHVWHVRHHDTLVYLVRWRHRLASIRPQ